MDYQKIRGGDLPGEKISVTEGIIPIADRIYTVVKDYIAGRREVGQAKTVIAFCGGSGVGKSTVAAIVRARLNEDGIGAYTMSGDNYPYRIPAFNDAKRERVYAEGGKEALDRYLGSDDEQDFDTVNVILKAFHRGDRLIPMKRMGRKPGEVSYEKVDFSDIDVLILEWTHANSDDIRGVDFSVLLNSTPQETLEFRRARARDGHVDSPFVSMVLELEQKKLAAQAHKAKLIVSRQGEFLTHEEFQSLMRDLL